MLGAEWYKRWRHGRGFGIHSPSAYRLVREVLRPAKSYVFYAYDDIARARGHYPTMLGHGELELIYRILVYLRPATVAISDSPSKPMLEKITAMALPQSRVVSDEAEMLLCEGLQPCPLPSRFAYFTDAANPVAAQMIDAMESGHVFRNPSRALVINNPALIKQIFEIRF